jgi:methionyl-tRNA formyltransferase
MSRPRVVFMGTPEFAVPALRAVAEACDVALVVSQPDRPRGRGRKSGPTPVAAEASARRLSLWQPETLKGEEAVAKLTGTRADLFAVVAYGEILSRAALGAPRLGAINLHASLLPAYRGASPIQRALWDGRTQTGVTTMWMDEGLDTGDLIHQTLVPITGTDTAGTLAVRLAEAGAPLLATSLTLAHEGRAPRHPQPREGVSHAPKLAKSDGVMDWSLDAAQVWNHARAVTPWPGAATGHGGKRLIVLRARPEPPLAARATPGEIVELSDREVRVACGAGTLLLERVKPEGRGEMDAAEWARGVRLSKGDLLSMEKENAA